MPEKTIGVYLPNQPTSSEPTRQIPLSEAHKLKREKKGQFVEHGKKFRLFPNQKLEDGSPFPGPRFHGASCVIDDKPAATYNGMMLRFAQGDYYAHAAVNAWRFKLA